MLVSGRFRATHGMDYFRMADGPEAVQASSISQKVGSRDRVNTKLTLNSTEPQSRCSPPSHKKILRKADNKGEGLSKGRENGGILAN